MPIIKFQTVVQGKIEQVYEHVTGFAATGRFNQKALEEKHGPLLEREGDTYIFREDSEDGVTWRCAYDPPRQRIMRAQESNWADRIDLFEPRQEGTLWTVIWEPKARGFRAYTQWLGFRLRGKRQVYQEVILPVVRHFEERPSTRRRSLTRRRHRRL